jgi:hypothetical protein
VSESIPEQFKQLRGAGGLDRVSIGYGSIELVPLAELPSAQQGYVDPGDQSSGWQPEWLVIGHEGLCGDPLFIDTDDDDFPVYAGEHGTGAWQPRLIAFSFRHFGQILERLKQLSQGRSNPVEFERHPISAGERVSFMEFIRRDSPDVDFGFWESLLELR